MNDREAKGVTGFGGCKNQDKTSIDRAVLRKGMCMHECMHMDICVCVHARVCCDMPISHSPPASRLLAHT